MRGNRREFVAAGTALLTPIGVAGCMERNGAETDDSASQADGGTGDVGGTEAETGASDAVETGSDEAETESDEAAADVEPRVGEIVDTSAGDIAQVEYENGETGTIRLAGVEAPPHEEAEIDAAVLKRFSVEWETDEQRAEYEADLATIGLYGRNRLRSYYGQKRVELEPVPSGETDDDGNPIVFVFMEDPRGPVDDMLFANRDLVRKGYAQVTDDTHGYEKQLEEVQQIAKDEGHGFWGIGEET